MNSNTHPSFSQHPIIWFKRWLKSKLLSDTSSRGARAAVAFLLEWFDGAFHVGLYWLAYVCVFSHVEENMPEPMFVLLGIAWSLLWLFLYGAFACVKTIKAWKSASLA